MLSKYIMLPCRQWSFSQNSSTSLEVCHGSYHEIQIHVPRADLLVHVLMSMFSSQLLTISISCNLSCASFSNAQVHDCTD